MTDPSKDLVRITPELAGELLRQAADEIERLQRENDGLTRDCNDKDITIERLRTTLTGISTCSTCEACRGAALRALGEQT